MKNAYKVFIIVYLFYISFSAQSLALTAEVLLRGESFAQIVFDDTPLLEQQVKGLEDRLHKERIEKNRSYMETLPPTTLSSMLIPELTQHTPLMSQK